MANENLFCPYCKKEFERIYDLYVHLREIAPVSAPFEAGHAVEHNTSINCISSLISRFCHDKYNHVEPIPKNRRFPSYDPKRI